MPRTLRLLLGDQLNHQHSWLATVDPQVTYVLMEMRQETDYVRHHVQKVLAFFAAMRAFAAHLRAQGHQVVYLTLDDPANTQQLTTNLDRLLAQHRSERLEYQLPDEYRLDQQLQAYCAQLPLPSQAFDTEHFLTTRHELQNLFKGKKTYLMEAFYRKMRQKHQIMLEPDGQPTGGRWNFDHENRRKFDGKVNVPAPLRFLDPASQAQLAALRQMIEQQGVATLGQANLDQFDWYYTRPQAQQMLAYFVERALPHFGTYQDALHGDFPYLFHSRLSFALNVKLLHPLEVVEAALAQWQRQPQAISLPQIEGFVRQIIGWREYMRGIYWAHMPQFATLNFFEHRRPLPAWYWTGQTRMNCLRHAVGQSLERAYAHHIQRLMVTGAFANLAGVDPAEVDAWYLGIYADAIEWVEITNTRGMSQYADGGIVGTKPYVGSANYLHKMGNHCASCYYDKDKKHGDRACPFNSLYWHFYHRHRDKLARNPRIGMAYVTLDKMPASELAKILQQAEHYLAHLDEL
ncbi:MAG: cryptochrome/photolyase family protein [Bernardetiaceae bacterium]|nr:cryptochrome/photolyase family protein [Bernardetiaceae bacterium]